MMAEAASHNLEQRRLLTEVEHIRTHFRPDGILEPDVDQALLLNRMTSVEEMSIPAAVTTSVQRVEIIETDDGRSRRTITWLGKTAVQVAESGYEHHISEAAFKRVRVEVAEAQYHEAHLQPGMAHLLISPKMSRHDASTEIAKLEHLHDDDAIRVSYPVTDNRGAVTARRIESLLVTGIELPAWIRMLRDPDNLFGKSFDVTDERSALSVMELFDQMSLPEASLPEGPVTIVEAVLPYIADLSTRCDVEAQLEDFRNNQKQYHKVAEKTARKWLDFDIELARSLDEWSDEDLHTILRHDVAGEYIMTNELAAVLEKANEQILKSQAAVAVNSRKLRNQAAPETMRHLQSEISQLEIMCRSAVDPRQLAAQEARVARIFARQNFKLQGGCAGGSQSKFKDNSPDELPSESSESELPATEDSEDQTSWAWKKGVCRVNNCLSPKPTDVGPCRVCRSCQRDFDEGIDPTKGTLITAESKAAKAKISMAEYFCRVLDSAKPSIVAGKLIVGQALETEALQRSKVSDRLRLTTV